MEKKDEIEDLSKYWGVIVSFEIFDWRNSKVLRSKFHILRVERQKKYKIKS